MSVANVVGSFGSPVHYQTFADMGVDEVKIKPTDTRWEIMGDYGYGIGISGVVLMYVPRGVLSAIIKVPVQALKVLKVVKDYGSCQEWVELYDENGYKVRAQLNSLKNMWSIILNDPDEKWGVLNYPDLCMQKVFDDVFAGKQTAASSVDDLFHKPATRAGGFSVEAQYKPNFKVQP